MNDFRFDMRSSEGFLKDEKCTISYKNFPFIFSQLDDFFGETSPICIAVTLKNTPVAAVLISYLVDRNHNCYLSSGILNNQLPAFCDFIVSFPNNSVDIMNFAESIEIQKNPNAVSIQGSIVSSESQLIILSSSGSTGTPKYICFKKDNLVSNALNCVERFKLNSNKLILATVPLGHMFGLGVGLLPALLSRASIALVDKSNIIKFIQALSDFKPHFTLVTPSMCRMAVKINKTLPNYGTYISAGEQLDFETYRAFENKVGPLVNLYGCSELGAIATSPQGEGFKELRQHGAVTPLGNVTLKISKDRIEEILCNHPSGFESYVDNFGVEVNNRPEHREWYCTKDRGTFIKDTYLKVLGRTDNCINRSGFLISLEEIESKLKGLFSDIRQLVVIEKEQEESANSKVIAICETVKGSELDQQKAIHLCRESINQHFIPNEFHFVAEIAKLKNGKPDRRQIIHQFANTDRI